MVIADQHAPGLLRHWARPGSDLAGRSHLFGRLVAAEDVGAGVAGIGQKADHARMRQPTPDELSVPRAAVRTAWKVQPKIMEAPHHRVGGAFLFEKLEDGADRALDLLVRVEDNLVVVEDEPDRQWESQFTPGGFVQFAAVEARADDMQLRLGESALHAEYQAVVELGGIVAPVLVDHEGAGDGAQFEKAMPILVRSRQSRRFQREDGADLTHRYIADQSLEVDAVACSGARLAKIAVEDPNLFLTPPDAGAGPLQSGEHGAAIQPDKQGPIARLAADRTRPARHISRRPVGPFPWHCERTEIRIA